MIRLPKIIEEPTFEDGAKTTFVSDKTSPASSPTFSGVKANALF